ncbi:hypothetical protein [Glycocaulis sp.]|uniref:hypothetical protein n=1 Tax=Glycocaulis sp. TaxID=1969725 RepID=UPI003F703D47
MFERELYQRRTYASKAQSNAWIIASIVQRVSRILFLTASSLALMMAIEFYARDRLEWMPSLSDADRAFLTDQLRLYAQILTGIFSIYFATIGIILSAGHARLRRDIIQMLTNEQVGSLYSQALVLAAMFCLLATALPLIGFEPGQIVYIIGTALTLLSAFALFPLGQRLFNFFDLNVLVRSEILPSIARHIENAANRNASMSLANHHSKSARRALEQLTYIDGRLKLERESLEYNLLRLTDSYSTLLLHYLHHKHAINHASYWYPRRRMHKRWFFAGDTATSMALETSSQEMLIEDTPDHQWLETEIVNKLAGHIELAFQANDFNLALKLLSRFYTRISSYAAQFHFETGMQELNKLQKIIERAFINSALLESDETRMMKIGIADTWAALGSNLCQETLRRMITFEKNLKEFFEADDWTEDSLKRLPTFLQVDLALIVERIEFEQNIEGQRLSKPKYVQQLAVQKLLQHYSNILPEVYNFHHKMVPSFVATLMKLEMSEAATQVTLASLHNHWKLPKWIANIADLISRYGDYEHYKENQYLLPNIDLTEMSTQLESLRDEALALLGNGAMVGHIFESESSDELPDHFGQIYFELAEACVRAIEQNDEEKLDKILPMFVSLAILAANSKFLDPSLDLTVEFRLHLISTAINDLAAILGFAILYGAYFNNDKLFEGALAEFDTWAERAPDKQQHLKRMILLSNPYSFSVSASPRGLIRTNWKLSFERRARNDGFGDRTGIERGDPHPHKTVREFLRSFSDASHLFFAMHVVPQLETVDFEIDRRITELAQRLRDTSEEIQDEDR